MFRYLFSAFIFTLFIFSNNVSNKYIVPNRVSKSDFKSYDGIIFKFGTLGLGVDYEHYLNDYFAIRFNINKAKLSQKRTMLEIPFNGTVNLFTAGVLLDFHLGKSPFRLTGGLYYNGNRGEVTGRAENKLIINNHDFNLKPTYLYGKINFKKSAPYFGLGWSSVGYRGIHLSADFGILYHGTPKFTIKGETTQLIKAEFDKELNNQKKSIFNILKDYDIYPVISIGIEAKF